MKLISLIIANIRVVFYLTEPFEVLAVSLDTLLSVFSCFICITEV